MTNRTRATQRARARYAAARPPATFALAIALAVALGLGACSGGPTTTQDAGSGDDSAIGTGDTADAHATDDTTSPDDALDAGPKDDGGDAGEADGGDASEADTPDAPDASDTGDDAPDAASPCEADGACDDGDPCTIDGCVPATGECLHLPAAAGTACDDQDACTNGDACDGAGACQGMPSVDCDDDNPCTDDTCDPADGTCFHAAVEGLPCDDGDACTAESLCTSDGTCQGTDSVDCDDGLGCSLDACDPETGACTHDLSECACISKENCDDQNPCTADSCDPDSGTCANTPLPGAEATAVTCDDGNACTEDDACVDGVCQGTPKDCDDQIACTLDSCDPATGTCVHDAAGCGCLTDADCEDGDACTTDTCEGNVCVHATDPNEEGQACLTTTANGACLAGSCRGVVEVAVGTLHACARLASGDIRCWGAKDGGALCVPPQVDDTDGTGTSLLDDPTEGPSLVQGLGAVAPAEVPTLPALAAGTEFTCALVATTDGGAGAAPPATVRCWGTNSYAQLGLPSGGRRDCADADSQPTEVRLLDDTGVAQVITSLAAGVLHTCALTADGLVRCWGANSRGQLGTGGTNLPPTASDGRLEPSTVDLGGEPAMAIAAGDAHTCALLSNGDVRCWGANGHGQLGTGDVEDRWASPTKPASTVHFEGDPAVAVAAGSAHTCVILTSGFVRCWGQNQRGQLGAGHANDLMDQPGEEPSFLSFGDDPPVELALGNLHSCARTASGAVYCWGSNVHAQLGGDLRPSKYDAILDKSNEVPPLVNLGAPAVRLYAGGGETCALLSDEQVRCWGRNDRGQLGVGHTMRVGGGPYDDPPPHDATDPPDEWGPGVPMPPAITNAMGAIGVPCTGIGDAACLSQVCQDEHCAP